MNQPPNLVHLIEGLNLFNRGRFFEAHEALEDVWRPVPRDRPVRRHLQGMVQLAVAFHHQSSGHNEGAHSVLKRAIRNLNGADDSFPDLDLQRLRADLEVWRRYLDNVHGTLAAANAQDVSRQVAPDLPKILRRR